MASTASAAPARPDYRRDGSVRIGNETFESVSAYFTSKTFQDSGARCGSQPRMTIAEASPSDCGLNSTTINAEYNDNRVFIVQTVFHVIKKTDGTGAVTPELVQSQIDVLNEDFNALASTPGAMGHNIKVKFVLARKNPAGQPTTAINVVTNDAYFQDPGPGVPNAMKQALAWDPTRYFNIYTNDAAGNLGYATFPAEDAGKKVDGIVLLYSSVGRNSGSPPYDLGRTATHEVGHWLGLYHTFQGGCGQLNQPYTTGDLIMDTPREQNQAFGCTAGTTCQGTPRPIENYMNYTDDACMTKFTPEQSNRVRCSLINYRWINTAPTAAFTFAADMRAVTFTNASTDAQTPAAGLEYKWSFGDGMTSTDASPAHTYAADGTFEVTLEVYDPGSGASTTKQSVVVSTTPEMQDAGPGDGDGDGGVTDDAGGGNPDSGDGGGCCESRGGGTTSLLCAIPLVLVLRRRRRAA